MSCLGACDSVCACTCACVCACVVVCVCAWPSSRIAAAELIVETHRLLHTRTIPTNHPPNHLQPSIKFAHPSTHPSIHSSSHSIASPLFGSRRRDQRVRRGGRCGQHHGPGIILPPAQHRHRCVLGMLNTGRVLSPPSCAHAHPSASLQPPPSSPSSSSPSTHHRAYFNPPQPHHHHRHPPLQAT